MLGFAIDAMLGFLVVPPWRVSQGQSGDIMHRLQRDLRQTWVWGGRGAEGGAGGGHAALHAKQHGDWTYMQNIYVHICKAKA